MFLERCFSCLFVYSIVSGAVLQCVGSVGSPPVSSEHLLQKSVLVAFLCFAIASVIAGL